MTTTPNPSREPADVTLKHDWRVHDIIEIIGRPLTDLLFEAQEIHRRTFASGVVEAAQLLSIKTGACPEDCAYCPQSAHHQTSLQPERLMEPDQIVAEAETAKTNGATRFCMGAAWRSPTDTQIEVVADAIQKVSDLGLETCATLGMLTNTQALRLAESGLDYYNHNLDTSPDFYGKIITTRTYEDRLETLDNCRSAGLNLCTGGIVGMGESREDRAELIKQLASLDPHPESVPINLLIRVPGTPLDVVEDFDPIELVRTIAAARITMPRSVVRLSAGRENMTHELHALCFMAGANSIFLGDELLTTKNPGGTADAAMQESVGIVMASELAPVRLQ